MIVFLFFISSYTLCYKNSLSDKLFCGICTGSWIFIWTIGSIIQLKYFFFEFRRIYVVIAIYKCGVFNNEYLMKTMFYVVYHVYIIEHMESFMNLSTYFRRYKFNCSGNYSTIHCMFVSKKMNLWRPCSVLLNMISTWKRLWFNLLFISSRYRFQTVVGYIALSYRSTKMYMICYSILLENGYTSLYTSLILGNLSCMQIRQLYFTDHQQKYIPYFFFCRFYHYHHSCGRRVIVLGQNWALTTCKSKNDRGDKNNS